MLIYVPQGSLIVTFEMCVGIHLVRTIVLVYSDDDSTIVLVYSDDDY